ncbi:unnamed protein product, partial [Leptidea sinapis]
WQVRLGGWGCGAVCQAAAALALTPRLLARVVPPHSFRHSYTGKFRFRFWVFGTWRDVYVDDRLPTRAGNLLATTCALHDDFTLPLLEKAFAKLHGSYGAARAIGMARALSELSGGVLQSFSPPHQVPALLLQEKEKFGVQTRNGLIGGQAYCVTGIARVHKGVGRGEEEGEEEIMVRVRAPSGRGKWSGRGSRGGADW